MKRLRNVVGVVSACALLAGVVNGEIVYTWIDNGATDAWTNCDNWLKSGTCLDVLPDAPERCYPAFACHHAVVPVTTPGTPWQVDLTSQSIGSLVVNGATTFGSVSGTPVLKVETLVIDGPSDSIMSVTFDGGTVTTAP